MTFIAISFEFYEKKYDDVSSFQNLFATTFKSTDE